MEEAELEGESHGEREDPPHSFPPPPPPVEEEAPADAGAGAAAAPRPPDERDSSGGPPAHVGIRPRRRLRDYGDSSCCDCYSSAPVAGWVLIGISGISLAFAFVLSAAGRIEVADVLTVASALGLGGCVACFAAEAWAGRMRWVAVW